MQQPYMFYFSPFQMHASFQTGGFIKLHITSGGIFVGGHWRLNDDSNVVSEVLRCDCNCTNGLKNKSQTFNNCRDNFVLSQ